MCELFGMTSRYPATVNLSISEFARHGGETAAHADGWGIAFYDDGDARLLREPEAAADSEWIRCLREHDIRSTQVIAHIRKATLGARSLKNTQPFSRELGGRLHLFAHNGDLADAGDLPLGWFEPIGDTDSEQAFCHLLSMVRPLWMHGKPSLADRLAEVRRFADRIAAMGPANFLYSDGELLFAHGHRRHAADGTIRAPGLVALMRSCAAPDPDYRVAGLAIDEGCERGQRVALLASVPLSDEPWVPLAEGEILVLRDGEIIERSLPRRAAPAESRTAVSG